MSSSDAIAVSIIVVSYNTREMTLECLRSVFRETSAVSFELIVLDNASSDGSAAAIRAEFGDRIALVELKENLGFAGGNNRAAEMAAGRYLLLLNPDTVVLDNAVGRLVAFAERRPGCGIWGGRTLFGDGSLNPASCWGRQTLWSLACQAAGVSSLFRNTRAFNPEGIGGWDRRGEREVDIVSGCFLLIRRDWWNRLGGFSPQFFMYGEEADLCLRARLAGANPTVTDAATIVHYGGASETIRSDKMVRLLKAKMDLIAAHFSPGQRTLGYWLLALWPRTRWYAHAALAVLGSRPSKTKRDVWKEIVRRRSEWERGSARRTRESASCRNAGGS